MTNTSSLSGQRSWLSRHSLLLVFLLYTLIFGLLFWGIRAGVGQYWDWSFPYFSDQIPNIFGGRDSSWTAITNGSPLGYISDYFFRFLVSLFFFVPPEMLRYVALVLIFAAGALGVYRLTRPYTSGWLAFLFGLAAFINPAIFYKYTAGHFNYLFSFSLFIYFLYFMLHRFEKNIRSSVIVGILLAFLGTQIQFFIISGIFLAVYFAFNREKFSFRYLAILVGVPILTCLVWLSNFLTGAADASQTSTTAAKASFKTLSNSSFLDIFTFNFSRATLLSKFYVFYELLWNALLFISLLWLLINEKRKERPVILLLVFLVIMIFMATGLYQALQIYPLTMVFPMLREVGHFAPVLVLVALLLVAQLVQKNKLRWLLPVILIGSLVMVGVKLQHFSQGYNFADVRAQFAPFKEITDSDKGSYRILSYPFFGQYSFLALKKNPTNTMPLSNSGHDSFAAFSSQSFLPSAVPPSSFKESPQYQLRQTYDIDVLRPYNVKYLFDFSHIYESNYDKYVPAAVYDNDLQLIKNDKQFFAELLARNPGKLRKVNDRVLEIKDYVPRVNGTDRLFHIAQQKTAASDTFTEEVLDEPMQYTSDTAMAGYATRLTPLFEDVTRRDFTFEAKSGLLGQTIPEGTMRESKLYADTKRRALWYRAINNSLTVYTRSDGQLLANRIPLAIDIPETTILNVTMTAGKPYYVTFNNTLTLVKPGTAQLGVVGGGEKIEVLTPDNGNLVQNASFEENLWREKVNDCNRYDNNAQINMGRTTKTASDGQAALELRATRHDACTYTEVDVAADTKYLLSYDYQSPDGGTASFYMGYVNEKEGFAEGLNTTHDTSWHTYTELITTGELARKAKLYFYAREQKTKGSITTRYDNVNLFRLAPQSTATIAHVAEPYRVITLPKNELKLTYRPENYTRRNLIKNGSFEEGSWQEKVSDCSNYDKQPEIAMQLAPAHAGKGKQSLELSAKHHDACVHTGAAVKERTEYLLSFDFQSDDAKYYGYALGFDDPKNSLLKKQLETPSDNGWHHVSVRVQVPAGASALSLYLYGFEDSGAVRYDNVSLVELPYSGGRSFVVQKAVKQLTMPDKVAVQHVSQSVRKIHATGVTTPFFITLGETYHDKWRLVPDTPGTSGILTRWLPAAAKEAAGTTHARLNDTMNVWHVDPVALCKQGAAAQSGCTKNTDGSYDVRLVAEFAPHRWFALATFTSWTTLIVCIFYLFVTRGRESPTYQSTWRQMLSRRERP